MSIPPVRLLPDKPFTRAESERRGVTSAALDRLIQTGQVIRVLPGVFQKAELADTIDNRVAAVSLIRRPFWVVADRTAAWLHGIDVLDFWELEILPAVDTVAIRGHSRVRSSGCNGGERELIPEDLMERDGVLLTTPLRTAMDLACLLRRREALAALDAFMRTCGVTRDQMFALLPRYFGRRGVKQLRELIPIADPRAESTGESWTRLAIIDAGLPVPETQVWVYDAGRPKYRIDLGYAKCKIAVEYDGQEFHDSDEQKASDEARRDWLRRRGWTVIVVRRESFTAHALEAWLNELRAALPRS